MKSLLTVFSILLIIVISGVIYYLNPPCKQPDELTVAFLQLDCAQNINIDELKKKACQALYNESTCQLKNEDLPLIESIAKDMINKCAKKNLVDQNLCIDKYKGI
jgi:hypothetical protein